MISIAISTISNRIESLALVPYENVEYVIIHQKSEDADKEFVRKIKKMEHVKYIDMRSSGLSRSRNAGIQNSSGDFIFIMDDDVDFSFDKMLNVIDAMVSDGVDVATFYHSFTDGSTTKKKDVSFRHNLINIANPSSIDICIRRKSLLDTGVFFDKDFGLGTAMPSGEEMIFLSDCLKKNLYVKRYPLEVCIHPPITSGADFYSTKGKILAKKMMFSRVYGIVGDVFFILFVIKKIPSVIKAGWGSYFILNALKILWRR